jgi:hypothetical protein
MTQNGKDRDAYDEGAHGDLISLENNFLHG